MSKIKISVIIPIFNEEKNIIDCLKSLDNQNVNDFNFEVIVIDDGSKDSSLKLVNSFVPKNYKISVLKQKHKGPAMARNYGALNASGEILVFIDADMTFHKDFLVNLTKPIVNKKFNGTTSIDEYVSNFSNKWARCWNLNEGILDEKRHKNSNIKKHTVFRSILKSEFDKVGGFSIGGYTDDYTLSKKLGYKAEVVQKAIFYHKNPDTLKEVFYQSKWAAKRKYKLGILGEVITLIKVNFIFSLLIGIYKATLYKEKSYILFKIVYDFGTVIGLYEYKIFGKGSK